MRPEDGFAVGSRPAPGRKAPAGLEDVDADASGAALESGTAGAALAGDASVTTAADGGEATGALGVEVAAAGASAEGGTTTTGSSRVRRQSTPPPIATTAAPAAQMGHHRRSGSFAGFSPQEVIVSEPSFDGGGGSDAGLATGSPWSSRSLVMRSSVRAACSGANGVSARTK